LKTILILGAGTAGTSLANKLAKKLDADAWKIIVVDRDEKHYYQPGFLFVPFGIYQPEGVVKPKKNYISCPVEFILSDVEVIEPEASQVRLVKDKRVIHYDYLVVATGCDIAPEETPGLQDVGWRKNIFDFYTYEGSAALARFLSSWRGGRLAVNVAEMPIKCPVAPLEFIFLADWFFHERGLAEAVPAALSLVRQATRPDLLKLANDAVVALSAPPEPLSLWQLIGVVFGAQLRQGLDRMLNLVKVMAG
jgi:sulfide:quinone oxidoreductase